MLRGILRWAFISTALLDCDGPELRPDPAQDTQRLERVLRGEGTGRAPSVSAAPGRLRNTQVLVCDGVPVEERDVCPLDASRITRVEDEDDGVLLHVRGTAVDVGNRVQCYRALASMGRVAGAGCVLDLPDVDVCVREQSAHVVVDLTRSEDEQVPELRVAVRERLSGSQALVR
jgi:hypothetical protein